MKEKEQLQNNNGVSKAIIIAVGLLLLLSACGNVTKMVFGPVVREVAREVESEIEREFSNMDVDLQNMEKELEAFEVEMEAVEKELESIEMDINDEINIQEEIIDGIKIEIEVGR